MGKHNEKFLQSYGPWALVTGASSGIGVEFARQLATAGLNIALVARREARLHALAAELERAHNIQTRTIAVDLSTPTAPDTIQTAVSDLEIGLLVNNAGSGVPGAFLKRDLADRTRVLQLNTTIPMQLVHIFGQQMSQRKRGGILLVSSLSAYMGTPYMADYAAAKAFLLNLGEAVHVEFKPSNVDVTVLVPGPTRTEMVTMDGTDMSNLPAAMWMDAPAVAKAGIRALGKHRVVVPGLMNKVMTLMMTRIMSRNVASNMFGGMMKEAMDPAIV